MHRRLAPVKWLQLLTINDFNLHPPPPPLECRIIFTDKWWPHEYTGVGGEARVWVLRRTTIVFAEVEDVSGCRRDQLIGSKNRVFLWRRWFGEYGDEKLRLQHQWWWYQETDRWFGGGIMSSNNLWQSCHLWRRGGEKFLDARTCWRREHPQRQRMWAVWKLHLTTRPMAYYRPSGGVICSPILIRRWCLPH